MDSILESIIDNTKENEEQEGFVKTNLVNSAITRKYQRLLQVRKGFRSAYVQMYIRRKLLVLLKSVVSKKIMLDDLNDEIDKRFQQLKLAIEVFIETPNMKLDYIFKREVYLFLDYFQNTIKKLFPKDFDFSLMISFNKVQALKQIITECIPPDVLYTIYYNCRDLVKVYVNSQRKLNLIKNNILFNMNQLNVRENLIVEFCDQKIIPLK